MAERLHAEQDSKYVTTKKKGSRTCVEHKILHPDDTEPFLLRASIVTDSGEIVLLDKANKNIKLLNTSFNVVSVMNFATYPFDICASNKRKSEYYVTEPEEQSIHSIGVGQGRLALYNTKRLHEDCRGITCWKSGIAVSVMREGFVGTLGLLDYNCKIKKKVWESELGTDLFRAPWYLESIKGSTQVVVSDQGNHSVICLDCKTLTVIFVFKNENLVGPRTLAIDPENNIYVIGSSETCHNVVRISSDGRMKGIVLSRRDKLNYPSGLCFNQKDNSLVLQRDREKPAIAVFSM